MAYLTIQYPISPSFWSKLKKSVGKYCSIMDDFKTKGPSDPGFQKKCDGFFRIRMGQEWREQFYDLFSDYYSKKLKPDFSDVLKELYNRTCDPSNKCTRKEYCLAPSFASKMVHLFNPNLPIWDSKVIGKLGSICGPYKTNWSNEKKLTEAPKVYEKLVAWNQYYLRTQEAKANISDFHKQIPGYEITQTKIIDFILWQL